MDRLTAMEAFVRVADAGALFRRGGRGLDCHSEPEEEGCCSGSGLGESTDFGCGGIGAGGCAGDARAGAWGEWGGGDAADAGLCECGAEAVSRVAGACGR